MPNREEHCKHTYDRYGVTGEAIHEWMDEPSILLGPEHREERHDPKQNLPSGLTDKYGEGLARDIMLDHILLDVKSVGGRVPQATSGKKDWLDMAKNQVPTKLRIKNKKKGYSNRVVVEIIEKIVVGGNRSPKTIVKVKCIFTNNDVIKPKNFYSVEITSNMARRIEVQMKDLDIDQLIGTYWAFLNEDSLEDFEIINDVLDSKCDSCRYVIRRDYWNPQGWSCKIVPDMREKGDDCVFPQYLAHTNEQ